MQSFDLKKEKSAVSSVGISFLVAVALKVIIGSAIYYVSTVHSGATPSTATHFSTSGSSSVTTGNTATTTSNSTSISSSGNSTTTTSSTT